MTRPRKALVSLDDTPYYHVVSRCVRRAFLCGEDRYSGKSFEHRRQWILDRIRQLASIFSVDICAYAIMNNHYHLVLHVNRAEAEELSDDAVIERWCTLFKGPLLVRRYRQGGRLSKAELETVSEIAAVWRQRLADFSWFMRCLNESIARLANQEDDCKGRFWEGRFRSQALLDVPALISAMVYVDLNPVRAGMADDLQGSDFTSVQERLFEVLAANDGEKSDNVTYADDQQNDEGVLKQVLPVALLPFSGNADEQLSIPTIPFGLTDYIDLCDWTGAAIRDDKRGSISRRLEVLLAELGLDEPRWIELTLGVQRKALAMIGALERIEALNLRCGRHWISGQCRLAGIYGANAA